MTDVPRISLRIGNLRVSGATRAEATAIASGLREALAADLAANPALAGQVAEHIQLTLSPGGSLGPLGLGRLTGARIAAVLSTPKGGG